MLLDPTEATAGRTFAGPGAMPMLGRGRRVLTKQERTLVAYDRFTKHKRTCPEGVVSIESSFAFGQIKR
jgi:hypothetical protein